jgi:predicted dehydrogenase
MSLHLTPEQREKGKTAFEEEVGRNRLSRRDFMKGTLAAVAAGAVVTPAVYFGYEALKGKPVRTGLIGSGDEGGVLVGNHTPEYLEFVAVADIRPFNQNRIFTGEPTGPRKGFERIYGKEARDKIKVYPDYHDLLKRDDIEAVVIALPLHLHAPVAIDAMRAGKHVLCEKLMAWNVAQCKEMIKVAEETNRILTIGHQRHYSLLYAHAVELLRAGTLGDIRHIRALWHRNNSWPRLDKDGKPMTEVVHGKEIPVLRDSWRPAVPEEDRKELEGKIRQLGYKNMEELVRWRLYNRTGGGLMAELGSHQLDACSIFLGKLHPLAVSGVGGKFFYHDDREVDDHVFTTYEFPGPNYYHKDDNGKPARDKNGKLLPPRDKDDVVVVTYSSINTNSEPYGECVMGTHSTLITENEESIYLFPQTDPNQKKDARGTAAAVASAGGGKPAVDSSASGVPAEAAKAAGQASLGSSPVSRGYTEEMQHFAYCVRMHQKAGSPEEQEKWRTGELAPRCHGRVAMADAIIALTSNLAMHHPKHQRIEFEDEWFDPRSDAVPDAQMKVEVVKG